MIFILFLGRFFDSFFDVFKHFIIKPSSCFCFIIISFLFLRIKSFHDLFPYRLFCFFICSWCIFIISSRSGVPNISFRFCIWLFEDSLNFFIILFSSFFLSLLSKKLFLIFFFLIFHILFTICLRFISYLFCSSFLFSILEPFIKLFKSFLIYLTICHRSFFVVFEDH